jgi:hypothetical protein
MMQLRYKWKAIDHTGKRFGRWTVIGRAPNVGRFAYWECRCDCGEIGRVRASSLTAGDSRSCGCYQLEQSTIHGRSISRDPEYNAWNNIKQRCLNPNRKNWAFYGGRGVTICDEWRNSFESFYACIGPRPGRGYSVDRIDNDRGYEPGNVRWATRSEQAQNQRLRRLQDTCDRGHSDWYQIPGKRFRRCRTCNALVARAYKGRRRDIAA